MSWIKKRFFGFSDVTNETNDEHITTEGLIQIMNGVHSENYNATEESSNPTTPVSANANTSDQSQTGFQQQQHHQQHQIPKLRALEERLPKRTSFDMRAQPIELKKYLKEIQEHGTKEQLDDDIINELPTPNQLDLSKFTPQILHCRHMRILLVRHAESEANVDKRLLTTTSDYTIPLSKKGIHQAHQAGKFIRSFYKRLNEVHHEQRLEEMTKTPTAKLFNKQRVAQREREEEGDGDPFTAMGYHSFSWDDLTELDTGDLEDSETETPAKLKVRIWSSPYKRARQTAEAILSEAREYIDDYKEHVLLGEQQFGLFEGVPLDELRDKFPMELEHFEKMVKFGGRFYARPPLGESRFDVCQRVYQTFNSFLHDAETKGIKDIIIVSHGVTLRAFCMMYMHYSPEWFEKEANPNNCSVRLLQGKHDRKYIYDGFLERSSSRRRDPPSVRAKHS